MLIGAMKIHTLRQSIFTLEVMKKSEFSKTRILGILKEQQFNAITAAVAIETVEHQVQQYLKVRKLTRGNKAQSSGTCVATGCTGVYILLPAIEEVLSYIGQTQPNKIAKWVIFTEEKPNLSTNE
jgi:hypothetical protein